MGEKRALREMVRERLRNCSELDSISQRICSLLNDMNILALGSVFAFYWASGYEVRLNPLAQQLLQAGKRIVYPRFSPSAARYELALVESLETGFISGKFGILEPRMECELLRAEEAAQAVFLVPGLAFDLDGHRLGRGGGYYDRLLSKSENTKIGVACACQIVDLVPVQQHDICMDYVVTENGVCNCTATPKS